MKLRFYNLIPDGTTFGIVFSWGTLIAIICIYPDGSKASVGIQACVPVLFGLGMICVFKKITES